MPGTINGIGTTYYGKKNPSSRIGVCEHCHNELELYSYETRLWFVVVFVPLIPLGRKQIIDYCSGCTWHKSLPVDQWEKIQSEAVRDAIRQAEDDPNDPEASTELHATLVAVGRHDEADRVAGMMAENFPDNAAVQLHLGGWHGSNDRVEESDRCFERALELEPENPAARCAVAIGCLQRGDIRRADELLAFMESSCPEQDPGILVLLASTHHEQGKQERAMELYEIVARDFPEIGYDKQFRKQVRATETALGRGKSILPGRPLWRRPWIVAGTVAALVLLGVWFYCRHLANSQDLHVVNALPVPVRVTVDGSDDAVEVAPGGRTVVSVSEGSHQAVITRRGKPEQTVDFEITNGFFERFAGDSVFVLNVDGAASILREKIIYSKNPVAGGAPSYRIHYGKEFLVFRDIDYSLGETPPQSFESESGRETKSRASVLFDDPANVVTMFPDGTAPFELLNFMEYHLRRDPDAEALLNMYWPIAVGNGQTQRVRDFLGKGLSHRPVSIEWHRTYQESCRVLGGEKELPATYDKMLAETPGDSALLYLRGRIEPDASAADGLYDRAIEADAENPYPRMAKAYRLMLLGDYAAARPLAAEAARLKPEANAMANLLYEIRLGLGEYAELEAELREAQAQRPLDSGVHVNLMVVLSAAGKSGEVERAQSRFEQTVEAELARAGGVEDPAQRIVLSRMARTYLEGRLDEYRRAASELKNPAAASFAKFVAGLEEGNLEVAEQNLEQGPAEPVNGYYAMVLSLAWSRQGNKTKADGWCQKVIEQFRKGTHDDRRMADLLAAGEAVKPEEVDELTGASRPIKLILLVLLAERSPPQRAALLERAEKLNLPGLFPRRFIKRTIADMKTK